jgi:excisionase family DNA binding protein
MDPTQQLMAALDGYERRTGDVTEPRTTEWLTQQEAADRIGVHLRTIERHRAAGRLPTYRAGTKRGLRFRVEDVDALLQLAGDDS